MIKVRAHTCYLGHTGFAAHARNFFRELSKYTDLRVRNYTWDQNPVFNPIDYSVLDLITLTNSDGSESDYPISQSFPGNTWKSHTDFNQDVDIVLMDMHHKYFYETYQAPIKIAYTVWESTELETGFLNQLMKFDYLWVVTKWHRDMAIKQGYPKERILIVNEGVDSIFFAKKETVNNNFRFLFFGRWDYRKAVPEIIQTFLKAFPDNNKVELLLSADNPYSVDGFNSTEERLAHYKINDPRIKILHFPSREEYVNHIKSGNVLITCARSEGWNIPLIEAMAAGTPAIYSDWGAQLEFAKGLGNPVKIEKEVPANIGRDLGFAGDTPGLYAEPDYNDLQRVLLDCYDNYDIKKNKALNESKIIQGRFNWEKIGMDGFTTLNNIYDRKIKSKINGGDEVIVMASDDSDHIIFTQNDNLDYDLIIDGKKYIIRPNMEYRITKVHKSDTKVVRKTPRADIKSSNIHKSNDRRDSVEIKYTDGPSVEILGDSDYRYAVRFIDTKTSKLLYSCEISPNHWTKCSIKYFVKWKIEIENLSTGEIITDIFDIENKVVEVMLDSASLGDTIAWMPHVNEFAEINNCRVKLSTFKDFLFDKEKYPRISFTRSFDDTRPYASDSMNPSPIDNEKPYAYYKIGWFYNYQSVNNDLNPRDFKAIPLQATTSDILGIEYYPLKPFIKVNDKTLSIKSKYICIGVHSTAQAKYWNNPTGWQDIVDHYRLNGYEVVIVSSEGDGYMGNKNPEGAIYMKDNSMDTLMSYLYNCDMFIGISSGISWLSWALNKKTVIISGFSKPFTEPLDDNVVRIFNKSVCNGCFNTYKLDAGDWNWCPINKGTSKQFECSKSITAEKVISIIESGKSPQYENVDEIEYTPVNRDFPNTAEQPYQSAWGNIPTILKDIVERFDVDTTNALEFGVEYGYSTSAIANYFTNVLGVDIFTGDIHSGIKDDHMEQTKNYLEHYENITLLKSDYRDFIKDNHDNYGLIHIDIIHEFEHTYECGAWAVQHSRVTIFHDTESYFEVKRACQELANDFDLEFYNYKESHGLGILVNRKIK